jgi:hypothetical protein
LQPRKIQSQHLTLLNHPVTWYVGSVNLFFG